MFTAILKKEYLKIKYIYLALLVLFTFALLYLYMDLIKRFSEIEPHSMVWYEVIHIGNLYYEDLKFFPALAAVVLSLAQFLPEIHKKKFRIPLHLPINQNRMVLLYLLVGFLLLLALNLGFLLALYLISLNFFPSLVALNAIITSLPWVLASFVLYIGTSAVMIEPYWKRKSLLILVFLMLSFIFYLNNNYSAYEDVFLILLFVAALSLLIPLLSLYRFKNGNYSLLKEKTIIPKLAYLSLLFCFILSLGFYFPKIYTSFTKDNSLASYVFFSPSQDKFIYKQHYGGHNFIFGDSLGNTFNRKEFEEALPFTYWRNLDIQKRLPLIIKGIKYSKKQIKQGRQSFRLTFKNLYENSKQIPLYPLFNPSSKKGMIAFPDIMFSLQKSFEVYNSEHENKNSDLESAYTKILLEKGFVFPAKIIAGKTTNIKPLDEGYFLLDSEDKLFHMKKYDDKLYVKNIHYNSDIKIKYIKISESRKKEFYGTLLSQKNEVYLITYDDYKLVKLPLKHYKPESMILEIYANSLNKTIRYRDEKNVYALALDKNYNYLGEFKVSIPQVNPIYKTIYEYIFPFIIEENRYKTFEEYSFKIASVKAFKVSFVLALLYFVFLYFRKKDLKSNILRFFLILFAGIFALIFLILE